MKRLFLTFFMLLAIVARALESVSLQWDSNVETDLAGYKIYVGTNSGVYYFSIDVGNTTTTSVGNLKEGVTYYFVATAYNTSRLESDYSNEVSYTVPSLKKPPASVAGFGATGP